MKHTSHKDDGRLDAADGTDLYWLEPLGPGEPLPGARRHSLLSSCNGGGALAACLADTSRRRTLRLC